VGYSIVTFDEAGFFLVPVYRRVWFFRDSSNLGRYFPSFQVGIITDINGTGNQDVRTTTRAKSFRLTLQIS